MGLGAVLPFNGMFIILLIMIVAIAVVYYFFITEYVFKANKKKTDVYNIDTYKYDLCLNCGSSILKIHDFCPYCGSSNIKRF